VPVEMLKVASLLLFLGGIVLFAWAIRTIRQLLAPNDSSPRRVPTAARYFRAPKGHRALPAAFDVSGLELSATLVRPSSSNDLLKADINGLHDTDRSSNLRPELTSTYAPIPICVEAE